MLVGLFFRKGVLEYVAKIQKLLFKTELLHIYFSQILITTI